MDLLLANEDLEQPARIAPDRGAESNIRSQPRDHSRDPEALPARVDVQRGALVRLSLDGDSQQRRWSKDGDPLPGVRRAVLVCACHGQNLSLRGTRTVLI